MERRDELAHVFARAERLRTMERGAIVTAVTALVLVAARGPLDVVLGAIVVFAFGVLWWSMTLRRRLEATRYRATRLLVDAHPYRSEPMPVPETTNEPAPRLPPSLLRRGAGAIVLVSAIAALASLLGPGGAVSPRRWTFLESAAVPADLVLHGGPWSVEDDEGATGARALVSRPGDAAAVIVAPAPTRDFGAVTRCKTAGPDAQCGLVFRYRSDTRYEVVRLDTTAHRVVLASMTDGKELVIASAPAEAGARTWHELRVDASAGMVRVALNGRRLIEASEGLHATSGLVGLWAPAAGVAYFDELSIGAVADSPRALELLPILARPRG